MSTAPHPTAVLIARVALVLAGSIILSIGSVAYYSGFAAASWVWIMTFALGMLLFAGAFLSSATDVVASVIILVYPFD